MAPGELDDGVVSLPYGLLQVVEAGNHVPALPHLLLVRLDHSENKYVSCRSGVLRVLNIEAVAQSAKFQKTKSILGVRFVFRSQQSSPVPVLFFGLFQKWQHS